MKLKTLLLAALALLFFSRELQAETIYTANEDDSSLSVITWPGRGESFNVPLPDMPHNVDMAGDGKFILVTGMSGVLLVLDPADVKSGPLRSIDVGRHPAHVVADNAGKFAYVTLSGEDAVAMVDLDKGDVVRKMPVGRFPHGLRMSPDGAMLYIANMDDGTVSVVSLARHKEIDRISVGETPVQVAVTPDGKTVYVSLRKENAVAVIDAGTHQVVTKAAVGPGPIQLFVADNRLLVANQGSRKKPGETVTVIDTGKNEVLTNIKVGKGPHGVAVSPHGRTAFVTNVYADTVSVIDIKTLTRVKTIAVGRAPNGITAAAGPSDDR